MATALFYTTDGADGFVPVSPRNLTSLLVEDFQTSIVICVSYPPIHRLLLILVHGLSWNPFGPRIGESFIVVGSFFLYTVSTESGIVLQKTYHAGVHTCYHHSTELYEQYQRYDIMTLTYNSNCNYRICLCKAEKSVLVAVSSVPPSHT